MIDRRQLIVDAGVSLVAVSVLPAAVAKAELLASHWAPTCRFAVGDQLGYVVDSFMRCNTLLYTVVVTEISEERGGWNFETESIGKPVLLFPEGEPYNSYDQEAPKRLWHLFRFGPARPR
jgi:hypothetical protein